MVIVELELSARVRGLSGVFDLYMDIEKILFKVIIY